MSQKPPKKQSAIRGSKKQSNSDPVFSRSEKILFFAAVVMWLIPIGSNAPWLIIRMALLAAAFGMLCTHIPWVRNHQSRKIRLTVIAASWILLITVACWYTHSIWPPTRRHKLSEKEAKRFEEPLRTSRDQFKSVKLFCSASDNRTCIFARQLIPLFLNAGWTPDGVAQPAQLPVEGITIMQHTDSNPDPHNAKLGVWEHVTNTLFDIRQAFLNIKIEPDSGADIAVPANQIYIYVGSEREDELAPTELTRSAEQIRALKKSGRLKSSDYPEIQ